MENHPILNRHYADTRQIGRALARAFFVGMLTGAALLAALTVPQ